MDVDTDFTAVPDWRFLESSGAGLAMADLDGAGTADVVVLAVDESAEQNAGYYQVGHTTDADGTVGSWGPWMQIPDWFGSTSQGAGIAIADVNGDGTPDLVVLMVNAPEGQNAAYYRVGWSLDADGQVTGDWTPWTEIPDWFPWENQGADIALADADGDGGLDLVVLMVDAPEGANAGYYRSGPLAPDGTVTGWRAWVAVPDWRFWENQGAGVAVADLDGDGVAELLVFAVDNPAAQNGGFYSVGWHLDGRGRPTDGWGPWETVPDWRFWENSGAAVSVVPLGPEGAAHLAVLAVDNPAGANGGWYRFLDVRTDLETAPQLGVWRLLEETSQVLAVHAALLHTGGVMFFAGSSNDEYRHADHQYGTALWHYPASEFSRPDTPVDLFCCGHAFLPDGRLLACGGTEQYDPFFGLRQAVIFDPNGGGPDPASATGTTGAWIPVPDMAGGRWYPALVPLSDGHVLTISGLDGASQLNVVPEIFDGAGWQTRPASPHWPMYAHMFLLADGRLFYTGGQYGGNNGVKPAVWDLVADTTVDVLGLPLPGARNQSASVLLPPAQDQRVMITGGGPFDMHDQTGANASTAIVDLAAAQPVYVESAPMTTTRMHLCATLLPDSTVLVNGGARMEESALEASLNAELYHPGPGTWTAAAASRVPRLYHSTALLMPDGTVITAGSNPERRVEELRIEVFWPPYLFAGDRPACQIEQSECQYGGTLTAQVPDPAGIASACLIRPGATTHSSNNEQRLIDLPIQAAAAGEITLQLPGTGNLAPPGWYLLFVVGASGVPSPGRWVHLT